MRGWPVSLSEPHLLGEAVGLRPVRVSDARAWREIRVRNAPWLRPWEPTNPETPLYRSSLGPYVAMVRAMRREARQGQAIPWVVTYGREFVQFAQAARVELRKVVWPSRTETFQTTYVVIGFAIVMGLFFFVLDWILTWMTRFLGGTPG